MSTTITTCLTHNTKLSVCQPNNALMPLKTVARTKTTTKTIPHPVTMLNPDLQTEVRRATYKGHKKALASQTLALPQKMVYFDRKDVALQLLFQLSAHG